MNRGHALRLAWYWLPLAAYAGAIFVLSSMAHPPIPSVNLPHFDKVLHFTEFAGFALLVFRALWMGGQGLSPQAALVATLVVSALYGVSDELHQMLVPNRQADPGDLVADLLGASCGAGLFRLLALRKSRPAT